MRLNESYVRVRIGVPTIIAVTVVLLSSCIGENRESAERTASTSSTTPALGVHRSDELVAAAKEVVAFLRGGERFDRIWLADTVTLYLSPEGGGAHTAVTREKLADRANWKVASEKQKMVYSLVPPGGLTKLTTLVGRHFNCLDYPLSSRFEELARFPQIGTKLESDQASSCLQSWNLTLVFDPEKRPPTVITAVYDQWEW